jgi:hypothetical protein
MRVERALQSLSTGACDAGPLCQVRAFLGSAAVLSARTPDFFQLASLHGAQGSAYHQPATSAHAWNLSQYASPFLGARPPSAPGYCESGPAAASLYSPLVRWRLGAALLVEGCLSLPEVAELCRPASASEFGSHIELAKPAQDGPVAASPRVSHVPCRCGTHHRL